MRHMTIAAVAVLTIGGIASAGGVLFVDDDAAAGGDGLGWDSAYRFLQDALVFASEPANGVTEIRVGQGIYTPDRDEDNPDGTGDREATFEFVDDVVLMGGYAGIGAQDPDERDVDLYETILSGDLLGDDGEESDGFEENSYHILIAVGADLTAVLDGFTVERGVANGRGEAEDGGGIVIDSASLSLTSCRFRLNMADQGASLYAFDESEIVALDVVFEDNFAVTRAAALRNGVNGNALFVDCVFTNNSGSIGAVIYSGSGEIAFENCSFSGNIASSQGGVAYAGGGLILFRGCLFDQNEAGDQGGVVSVNTFASGATLIAEDCFFSQNSAQSQGGAVAADGTAIEIVLTRCFFVDNTSLEEGGAISNRFSDTLLDCTQCTFVGNRATSGGAVHSSGKGGVQLVNCLLLQNEADAAGGAVFMEAGGTLVVQSSTVVSNTAASAGGIYIGPPEDGELTNVIVKNSILWDNSDDNGADEHAQLGNDSNGLHTIDYSCIQGLTGEFGGIGNIDADPQFVDLLSGLVRIRASSPCVDSGNNDDVPDDLEFDLDGTPRILDGNDDGVTVTDMGAYEFIFRDCDGNGVDDGEDILQGGAPDCNLNGIPDECDIDDGKSDDIDGNGVPDECQDCNGNGVFDPDDIAAGTSQDANRNGIPDECDADCNANGIPDFEDIKFGTSPDCNANGVPDECDIADGSSSDCDFNGVPDECDPDCNNDGIPDYCEIAFGYDVDCNQNGVPDSCDIDAGDEDDCNANGIPDSCDVMSEYVIESGVLTPIDGDHEQSLVAFGPPDATGQVVFTFEASAHFEPEHIGIHTVFNGVLVGLAYQSEFNGCGVLNVDQLIWEADTYNEALAGGDALMLFFTPNMAECVGSFLEVQVSYEIEATSQDRNSNGIPDECELFGDLNGDGFVNGADLILLLGAWGECEQCAGCLGDLDGDCQVGPVDLIFLLGEWTS